MLSRRKLFGFLAAAPVVGAAAVKAVQAEPMPPLTVKNEFTPIRLPDPAEYKIRVDKFLINLKEQRLEIND